MNIELWNTLAKANSFDSIEELLTERHIKKKESLETIALDLNVHRRTIGRLLAQLGITNLDKNTTIILSEYEATNLTLGQIARRYNVSKSTAWRLRKKLIDP